MMALAPGSAPDDLSPQQRDVETGAQPVDVPTDKGRRALSKVRRELTDRELSSAGAKRMLLAEIDRLEREVEELRGYRGSYFEADKERAVLERRLKVSISADIIFGVCISVGTAVAAIAPAIWDKRVYALTCLVLGTVLVLCGIIAKVVRT